MKLSRNEEILPDENSNPRDCFHSGQECRYAAGDVRNSEQGRQRCQNDSYLAKVTAACL